MVWRNDDLKLYHGCTEQSLRTQNPTGIAIGTVQHGIDPFVGAKTPDFGLGFYATTWLDQAKSWANLRAMRRSGFRAVVLAFLVPRDDLAELEALVFTNEKVGYWPFVRYCRQGGAPHARVGTQERSYDIVYGQFPSASRSLSLKTVIKSASTR